MGKTPTDNAEEGDDGDFDETLPPKLRPVGVGVRLVLPPEFVGLFKSIAVFPDGSVGIHWTNERLVTFAAARPMSGNMQPVPANSLMVGCQVVYVKTHK